ncbi:MAG: hypothetical protein HQ559_01150, partial [Lentisphaerae bacterium]|nr:hypothetical protein [Lentisphaerota bacterium]
MATKKKAVAKKTKKSPSKSRSVKKPAAKQKSDGTCFVMMPFKDPFDVYYEAIFKPAIVAAHLDPVRADDLFRP